MGGSRFNESGSGSNYLCLPEDPQWRNYISGRQVRAGSIIGVEYVQYSSGTKRNNVFSESNNGGNSLHLKPAPCAVCYVGGRSTILMVPARTQCPNGWTTEYGGYLASESIHDTNRKRSSYICVDEAPEAAVGQSTDQSGLYPVQVTCGTLPCSKYVTGRELVCAVCSK